MRRIGNLYNTICSIENLQLADKKASKGKAWQKGVQSHLLNREENILQLQQLLTDHKYKTSEYTTFRIYEPKEREIFRLPYYPDRIVHHAIMNVMEPIHCYVDYPGILGTIKSYQIIDVVKTYEEYKENNQRGKYR